LVRDVGAATELEFGQRTLLLKRLKLKLEIVGLDSDNELVTFGSPDAIPEAFSPEVAPPRTPEVIGPRRPEVMGPRSPEVMGSRIPPRPPLDD